VPLRTIVDNAGFEGHVILRKVRESTGSAGFDAATGEYVDMYAAGIIDPTKVTRAALQNAVSVATLLLTTDALIADAPEKEEAPSAGEDEDMDY
jgi:chaperonin GroEL